MSIRFVCEQCHHPMDVPDKLEGAHGHCKHCGHAIVVPEAHHAGEGGSLRLRAAEDEPPRLPAHLLAAEVPLAVRPAEAEPRRKPEAVSDPDEVAEHHTRRQPSEYEMSAVGRDRRHSSAGPPPLIFNLPTLTARFLASNLRTLRDWLYVISLGSLVIVLLGYLYQSRLVLHLGAALVIASNIGMLAVGLAYLVTLPFKESFWIGLANLLIPFYAVYYWVTHWERMRRPVLNTLASFLPIALVGLAYIVYEEAPVVEAKVEEELPVIESRIEKKFPALEKKFDEAVGPLEDKVKRELRAAETPSDAPREQEQP